MSIFRPHIYRDQQVIGLWSMDESLEELLKLVDSQGFSLNNVRNYKSELKQRQWLAARVLLRDMSEDAGVITYDEIGAPLISNGKYISLSHSNQLVSILLCDMADVGVDIQHFSPKIERVKEKFCNPEELASLSKEHSLYQLHIIWCAKEAIYKKLKDTGLIFSENIQVPVFIPDNSGSFQATAQSRRVHFSIKLNYEIIEDYTLVYTVNT